MTGPVPPFFRCGECGGQIARWPMKNLLKQDILDWRHQTVPEGVQPHRAVLGTPVPLAELLVAEETPDATPEPIPAVLVPARPAMRDELPKMALSLDGLAAENDWTVEAWYMAGPLMDYRWRFVRMVQSIVLRLQRDGHRLVAVWQADVDDPVWRFEEAWSITHTVDAVTSPQVREAVKEPRAICETCHEPPALHVLTQGGLVCHAEFHADQGGT